MQLQQALRAAQARIAYQRAQRLGSEKVRLAAADRALAEGKRTVAINLYLQLAASRSRTTFTNTARERIATLQSEARQQHDALQERLSSSLSQQPEKVASIFVEYRALANEYARLPEVRKEIKRQLNRHRRDPAVTAILNEPAAAQLVAEAVQMESQGQICCAYQCYLEAEKLLPAASAVSARDRLAELTTNPQVVADAQRCADLQWCHRKFQQAERLVADHPEKARELFAQILLRAAPDTTIHNAASQRIARLRATRS